MASALYASRVEMFYQLARTLEPDEILNYEAISEATGAKRPSIHGMIRQVNKKLLRYDKRHLTCVRNVGYRMNRSDEHVGISQNYKDRARRQVNYGYMVVCHVKLEDLTPEERTCALDFTKHMSEMQHQMEASNQKMERQIEVLNSLLGKL